MERSSRNFQPSLSCDRKFQVMGPFHPINRQKPIDKGKLIDKLIIVYNRFLILSIVSVRRPDPTEPLDKIPALQVESKKTVPTEIFQSAPTQTTFQTTIPHEISCEFTQLRDQSALFIEDNFCIQSSQWITVCYRELKVNGFLIHMNNLRMQNI